MNGPPFRAEHIGSLLRPQALLDDRSRTDQYIAEAIRWQESLGLQVVTDGEFRRESWRLGFVSRVEGFERADAVGEVDLQVLGLVSTKKPVLEDRRMLLQKIRQAEKYVALEDLCVSPQCGFASHQKGSGLTFAAQEAKLRLVVQLAEEVWG